MKRKFNLCAEGDASGGLLLKQHAKVVFLGRQPELVSRIQRNLANVLPRRQDHSQPL